MIADYINNILKEELLLSSYYEKVMGIINNPNPDNDEYVEKHHILPKSLYPQYEKDENNIIALSLFNHIMIHYYLAYGVKSIPAKYKMASAFYMMSLNNSAKTRYKKLNEENIIQFALLAVDAKKNYKLVYKEKFADRNYREERLKKLKNSPFICLETGEVYYSISVCRDEMHINNLSKVLSGKLYSAKGYHFIYLSDPRLVTMTYEEIINDINTKLDKVKKETRKKIDSYFASEEYRLLNSKIRGGKPFKCLETKEIFQNIHLCCEKLHLSPGSLCKHLKNQNKERHVKGYHFIYIDEINNRDDETILNEMLSVKKTYFHQKRILCYETGIYYDSVADAERKTGVTGIFQCVTHKYKFAGGYHWFREDDDVDKDEYVKNNPVKLLNEPIINLSTNATYQTVKEAAQYLNVSTSMINATCDSQGKIKCKQNILLRKSQYERLSKKEIEELLTPKLSGVILKKKLYSKMISSGEWKKEDGWNKFQTWYKENKHLLTSVEV